MLRKIHLQSNGDTNRRTSVRFLMIALAMSIAVLLYLDRICLSTAAESVAADLEIDGSQLNWLLGAYASRLGCH